MTDETQQTPAPADDDAFLSPAEREAIAADPPDDRAVLEDIAGDDEPGDSPAENADTPESQASDPAEPDETPAPQPQPPAEVPRAYSFAWTQEQADRLGAIDGELAALGKEKADAWKRLTDADIDSDEYGALVADIEGKQDALKEERGDLRLAYNTASMAYQMAQQDAQRAWKQEQRRFLARSENAVFAPGTDGYRRLDAAVKLLAVDPEYQSLPDAEILERAAENVRAAFGISAPGSAPAGKANIRPKDNAPIPPTLGSSTPAAPNTGGEFDYLDRLEGAAYEAALSKLTPEQEARYLAA